VLTSKPEDIKKEIALISEKQKALDILIDIGNKFKKLYDDLVRLKRKISTCVVRVFVNKYS